MKLKLFPAILAILTLASTANAQIISATSGNWNAGATWVGGMVPPNDSDVVVNTGHTVTLTAVLFRSGAGNIQVRTGGTIVQGSNGMTLNGGGLEIMSGGTQTSSGGQTSITGADLTVDGSLTSTGNVVVTAGDMYIGGTIMNATQVRVVNGTMNVTGTVNTTGAVSTVTGITSGNIIMNGGTIMNASSIQVLTSGDIQMSGSSTIDLPSGYVIIQNGELDILAGGVFTIGSYLRIGSASAPSSENSGTTFTVGGDLELQTNADFENNSVATVTGNLLLEDDCEANIDGTLDVAKIVNSGLITNSAAITASDSIINTTAGTINFSADASCTTLQNYGTMGNGGGDITMSADFYNDGTMTGTSGSYEVALVSHNDEDGDISGAVDICDLSLSGIDHLDTDEGTVDFATVTFCGNNVTGIEDLPENNNSTTLSPNPTAGPIQIHVEGSVDRLDIINMLGSKVLSVQNPPQTNLVDLTHLKNGVYFVQVSNGHIVSTQKLIKN